jgi:asparagine synthase (glutamine-hydrolysing)
MVKEMCDLLQHGGPDDEGSYCNAEEGVALGNRRLALIDLSPCGHMPMSYANERYWITYNGELYNYLEIREELKAAGYVFKTNSDTEVILASFDAWGTNALRRFNGMFALAIWCNETKTILLARDGSGIKPLYYSRAKDGLVFASEMRAFSVVGYLQEENPNWPVYLLAYGHIPEPVTTLKDVKPLPKGCFLRYHINSGKWDIESFCIYNYIEERGEREEVRGEIRNTLEEAVKRHLISDAPIGVFLSGGLDSGIVATLAAKHHKDTLKTLSIDFEDKKFSEKKYQDFLLERLQCPNWQEVLTEKEFQDNLTEIIDDMDMPGCDGLNTWFISKYAKESGLKAVLSGIGGDELFGGYPSFRRMGKVDWLHNVPAKVLRAGHYSGAKKLKRLAYLSLGGAKGLYLFLRGQFVPSSIAQQLDASEREVWDILEQQPELNSLQGLSLGNRASWVEMNMYMQNQLLRDSDVMSMAHGVEIRVPFLDKDFVNLALKIRSSVKYSGSLPKQLLIDSFKTELPEPIWNRPKMGFSFPFAEWLGRSEFARSLVSEKNYEKFIGGGLHWSQFMSLMLLNSSSTSTMKTQITKIHSQIDAHA